MQKETKDFLSDVIDPSLVSENDLLGKAEKEDKELAEVPESIKDRRHRRLERSLSEERAAAAEIAEKLNKVNTDLEYLKKEREGSLKYKEQAERIIGNNTEEARAKSAELAGILESIEKRASESSLSAFEKRQNEARELEAQEQKKLDSYVEDRIADVEETYGLDLSSDAAEDRRERFNALMRKMSSKDKNGDIAEYADFNAVAEIFIEKEKSSSDTSRKKEIASRGGIKSSSQTEDAPENNVRDYLVRQGYLRKK